MQILSHVQCKNGILEASQHRFHAQKMLNFQQHCMSRVLTFICNPNWSLPKWGCVTSFHCQARCATVSCLKHKELNFSKANRRYNHTVKCGIFSYLHIKLLFLTSTPAKHDALMKLPRCKCTGNEKSWPPTSLSRDVNAVRLVCRSLKRKII